MNEIVYMNGEFLPRSEAHISIDDGGFLHGAGVFENMRAEAGRVFRLDDHLERLLGSANELLWPIEPEDLPPFDVYDILLEKNNLKSARIRMTVTSGSVQDGLSGEGPTLTICITASQDVGYPDSVYQTGISVSVTGYRQSAADPLVGHKTTNYLPRLVALREAQAKRCAEALWFTPNNLLAGGSLSNAFIVKEGRVRTPPKDTPAMPGIAREVVKELCKAADIPVETIPVTIDDLLDADEVFLTNSSMMVMPVCKVEQRDIGSGKPGEISKKLLADYRALILKECGDHGQEE